VQPKFITPIERVARKRVPSICIIRPLLIAVLLATALRAAAATPVTAAFDDNGLTEVRRGGVQFVKSGQLGVSYVAFADDKGKDVAADRSDPTISFEKSAQRLSYSWPWGAIRCRYTVVESRLNLELTIENDTAGPMSGVELNLLELQFPRRPVGGSWEHRYQMLGDNEDDITALGADYGSGVVTFCNDDPASAVRSGFSPGAKDPHETWNIMVTSPNTYGEQKAFVGPRSHKTFHFSLRFSDSGVPLAAVIRDLNEKFAAEHPFKLKWPDRRPIGMLSLSSGGHRSATNPRGWFNDPQANFVGPSGAKRFRDRMFQVADQSIAILKDMGAQGMIFWDMEGEEYPEITYAGDPRATSKLAPEMDAIAPEFFERFHKAGLRTGVCIRPARIVPGWDGKSKWANSQMGFDVVEEMNQKIIYAKKRLGCLLYYVDSNVRYYFKPDGKAESHLLEADAFKKLAEAHPDVLIIPEIPRPAYWSCTAPYQELRPSFFGSHAATDSRVRDIYPKAFSVINPIDGPAAERKADLVEGQRRGDILLFHCWYMDNQNKLFKSIVKEAAK